MEKARIAFVALCLAVSGIAVGEVWPADVKIDGERRAMSIWQVNERDAISLKTRKNVYLNGPTRQTLTPASGPQRFVMPSTKLTVDVTGWTSVDFRRVFTAPPFADAWRESVTGYLDGVAATIQIDQVKYRFVPYLVMNSPKVLTVTREAIDRLNAECATDLAAADRIYNTKRSDVIDATGKMSPENMTWALIGPLDMARTDDNLARYDTGEFVMYLHFVRYHNDPWQLRFNGHLFDARSGKWLGILAGGFGAINKDKTFEPADLEPLLARIRPAT